MEEEFDFDIVQLIIETIENEVEGLPVFFMRCEEDLTNSPYIIFSCTNERFSDRFDNEFMSEFYNIDITLWYTDPKDMGLYKKVRKALKNVGFKYLRCYDTVDEDVNDISGMDIFYGKLMEFTYKRFLF